MDEIISDFECDNCKKTFKSKKNLDYHEVNKVCINKRHICEYCGNVFPSVTNMQRHINYTCRIKKEVREREENEKKEKQKEIDYEKMKKDNEMLKLQIEHEKMLKELAELKSSKTIVEVNHIPVLERNPEKNIVSKKKSKTIVKNANTITNNTGNNNGNTTAIVGNTTAIVGNTTNNTCVINNNNYNVKIVRNGSEDTDKIGLEAIAKMINGFDTAATMLQGINFSDKYPENHNIFISNIKSDHVTIFDGNDWSLIPKTDIIDRLYERQKDYVEDNIDELKKLISGSKMGALRRWLDISNTHEKIKDVKKKIKFLLYNKRNIPMKTKKLIEKHNTITHDVQS